MAKKKKAKVSKRKPGKVRSKRRKKKPEEQNTLINAKNVVWLIGGVLFIFIAYLVIRILLNIQDFFP